MNFTYHTQCLVWLVVTIGCSLAPLGAQNKRKSATSDAGQPQGVQLFAAYCSSCHGLDGRGSQRAPDIAGNPRLRQATDSELTKIVREGVTGTGMPGFDSLGDANIQALIRQVRALEGNETKTALPGSPESGKSLFFGKAACSGCHMVNGAGGFIGSDLSGYAGGKSAKEVQEALTSSTFRRGAAVVVITADGAHFDGIVRNEDNFSLQLQSIDGSFHFFEKSSLRQIERRSEPIMPDYASRLSEQELNDLVSYLIQLGRTTTKPDSEKRPGSPGSED